MYIVSRIIIDCGICNLASVCLFEINNDFVKLIEIKSQTDNSSLVSLDNIEIINKTANSYSYYNPCFRKNEKVVDFILLERRTAFEKESPFVAEITLNFLLETNLFFGNKEIDTYHTFWAKELSIADGKIFLKYPKYYNDSMVESFENYQDARLFFELLPYF